ncbi:MAG TPA: tail fiber protein, partial [Pyrinomonadaceae bacterium]|nr:tail fiber protein [Pyrinomonadaceae bacterium]
MAQPYVGEIRMFAGNFPPVGWMFCDGQLLPISENETLFQLIGTMYGGDGQSTFQLPDLQSRIPLHFGTGPDGITYQQAEAAGTESVTLTTQQIPIHTHAQLCNSGAGQGVADPVNNIASKTDLAQYSSAGATVAMGTPNFVSDIAGGSQPHENCQP